MVIAGLSKTLIERAIRALGASGLLPFAWSSIFGAPARCTLSLRMASLGRGGAPASLVWEPARRLTSLGLRQAQSARPQYSSSVSGGGGGGHSHNEKRSHVYHAYPQQTGSQSLPGHTRGGHGSVPASAKSLATPQSKWIPRTRLEDRENTMESGQETVMLHGFPGKPLPPDLDARLQRRIRTLEWSHDVLLSLTERIAAIPKTRVSDDQHTGRRAGIMLPLCSVDGKPGILFNLRSMDVGTHKGQVCSLAFCICAARMGSLT